MTLRRCRVCRAPAAVAMLEMEYPFGQKARNHYCTRCAVKIIESYPRHLQPMTFPVMHVQD